jgi:dienelactone hydrolase
MMRIQVGSRVLCCTVLFCGAPLGHAADTPVDVAARFGARVDIGGLRLSPDGMTLAFITPIKGQGSVLYTQSLAPGSKPKAAFYADGKPMRLEGCDWVSNDRLVCSTYGLYRETTKKVTVFQSVTKLSAVNADGTKPQPLGDPLNRATDTGFSDTPVIDWLPDQDGALLMAHNYPVDIHYGKMAGSNVSGVGVDHIDTLTLETKQVLYPRKKAIGYISDGRGALRIVAESEPSFGGRPGMAPLPAPQITYLYRAQGSDDWQALSTYNPADGSGFRPVAVDHDLNVAYGWKKLDGRNALYSMSLDGSGRTELVVSRPDVDLDSVVRIGRRNRVVAASGSADLRDAQYFAPDIKDVLNTLHQAMPKQSLISIVDANGDENKLVVLTGGDTDPGAYYILDRQARSLKKTLAPRLRLEGVTLAHNKAVNFPGADGTMISGSLTLPPGVDDPHGLPAVVMPQGAPSERDQGGFDWVAQYYAARGYVVLQPNFRGGSAYGDAWYLTNAFKAWDTAVSDAVASGKWLVSSGIVDPAKLGIVGWSFGGYAALQSVTVDPTVFKAIVAIAPVSDLSAVVGEHGSWSRFLVPPTFMPGADMDKESPISHADKFKQPVMLFHGTFDRNVAADESTKLAAALKAAGAQCDVVTYEDDDHALEDSEVRADMLRKSDAFLRHAFGMSP